MANLGIDSVRFGVHSDKTRMVIDLSEPSEFRSFMLPAIDDKPYRIVIDLPNFNINTANIVKPKTGDVLEVRSGNLTPEISRLVVDLKNPSYILNAFQLPSGAGKPDRLVIDFKTTSINNFKETHKKVFGNLNEKNIPKTLTAVPKATDSVKTIKPQIKPSKNVATTKTPLYKPLIVIDAGHGGKDSGAVGANKTYEKHITLAAAKELKKTLEATGKYRVSLTRSSDKFIKLRNRVNYGRSKEGDLFVSLHADSINNPKVRGASIYTLSNKASDAQTARLAARENRVDLIAGVDLSHEDKEVSDILIDLAMRDTMNQSKFFANIVVKNMKERGITMLNRPHRYAGFAVLKAPDIPSVLIEMGFMSNRNEVRMLSSDNYRRKIALSVTESVDAYFTKVRKNENQ